MGGKNRAAYMALFNYLRNIAPNFQPMTIYCDYEEAQVNAVRQAIPECRAEGSLWHYGVVSE